MELSYAITNTDGGIIAFVVPFVSIIFLGGLAFTIFMPRKMKSPPKLAKPSDELYISWTERRFLGVQYDTEPNLAARVRAFRARWRRNQPIMVAIPFIAGVIFTIFSAIVLIIVLSSFFFQQSWLARVIALNWALIGPYVFLPLFILLSVPCLAWLFLGFRLEVTKNIAPIRLKNETEKILKVFISGAFISEMHPGKEIENKKVPSMYSAYLIEANDDSGNVLYSKEFNLDELDALDWKVTIERESHNP